MPLVRVIAASAKTAEPVAQWLAQHGYQVETAYPEEPRNPNCDFEISVEQLSPAEALLHAQQLADALACDVLVAPGALQSLEPAVAEPAIAESGPVLPVEPETVAPVRELVEQKFDSPKPAKAAKPATARKIADLKKSARSLQKIGANAVNSLNHAGSAWRAKGRNFSELMKGLLQRSEPHRKNISLHAQTFFTRAKRYASELSLVLGRRSSAARSALGQHWQISRRRIIAGSTELREQWRTRNAQRQQIRSEAARLRVAAEARAAHQALAAAAERSAREPLAQLSQPALRAESQPVAGVKHASSPVAKTNTNHQPRHSRERDWQMALVGAAIMASVVMFALGFFTRSADSAASPGATTTIAQPRPIPNAVGPAVAPTPVSATTASPQVSASQPAATPSSAEPRPQSANNLEARAPNHARSASRPRTTNDSDDEQDVVVRHLVPKTPQPPPPAKTVAGVKQYSDME